MSAKLKDEVRKAINAELLESVTVVPMNKRRSAKHQTYATIGLNGNAFFIVTQTPLKGVKGKKYALTPHLNRTSTRLMHQAVDFVSEHKLQQYLFGNTVAVAERKVHKKIQWKTPDVNKEQMAAVRAVLAHPPNAPPYILWGPPGTGKTKTLVEAIYQILAVHPDSHVLVCATSNTACNEICTRLLQILDPSDIFRMYSASADQSVIDVDVLSISNLSSEYSMLYRSDDLPSLENLYAYKVVVATCALAGRLAQAKISTEHFDYVILDECGSATETTAIIPIAGVCTSLNFVKASVVIAGDPKQLGPVVKSDLAAESGFSRRPNSSSLCTLINYSIYFQRHHGWSALSNDPFTSKNANT